MKDKPTTDSKKKATSAAPKKVGKTVPTPGAKAKSTSKAKIKTDPAPSKTKESSKPKSTEKSAPASRARRLRSEPSAALGPRFGEVEVAAYLNWCDRKKQNLPDDAFADWIAAESEMGLVN